MYCRFTPGLKHRITPKDEETLLFCLAGRIWKMELRDVMINMAPRKNMVELRYLARGREMQQALKQHRRGNYLA